MLLFNFVIFPTYLEEICEVADNWNYDSWQKIGYSLIHDPAPKYDVYLKCSLFLICF